MPATDRRVGAISIPRRARPCQLRPVAAHDAAARRRRYPTDPQCPLSRHLLQPQHPLEGVGYFGMKVLVNAILIVLDAHGVQILL